MTKTWFTCLALLGGTLLSAQNPGDDSYSCAHAKSTGLSRLQSISWDKNPGLELYDVQYHKLDLALRNTSTYIEGKVTTVAKVINAPMDAFVFELHPSLTLDSVRVNGQDLPVTVNGNFKECALQTALQPGTVFTARIVYHGTPVATGGAAIGSGISSDVSPSWGNSVTWTLSQPYSAYEWWPCKQSLGDKIDSIDVWLTVGDSLKAGSNGLLQRVTPLSGNRLRYEWKHRYPIDYYLVSAAVAKYVEYRFYAYPQGAVDSVLIQNYVYDNPQTLNYFRSEINRTKDFIETFAQLFGPYPFENEKYGHCMAPFNGGMEHQTMTTQLGFSFDLTAHELAHQWFGDKVTCGSWKDIWVNEGFASYSEYLARERLLNAAMAEQRLNQYHESALSEPGGSVYVADTSDPNNIFSGRLTYDKGATLVHMLRFLVNDDALFFQLLRNYLQAHAYGTGKGEDIKAAIEAGTSLNLDNFFDEYYYGEGYPTFSLRWDKAANGRVYLRLSQTASMPSVTPLFHIPVEIRFRHSTGDTTVRVMSDAPEVAFDFAYSRPVSLVQIDPFQWILNKTGSIIQDATLGVEEHATGKPVLYPNPADDRLTLQGFATGETVRLTDAQGKELRRWTLSSDTQTFLLDGLAKGVYFIRNGKENYRFVKK